MGLYNRNAYQTDSDLVDHFSGDPEANFFSKWIGGIVVPFFISKYALGMILAQQAEISGRGGSMTIVGLPAAIFGLAWLSGAFFVHFHYFWNSVRMLCGLADLGKTLSLISVVGSLCYVLWSIVQKWF